MAIVGILVSIALPLYSAQIITSRRTDAKIALMELAGREERFFAIANQYTATASELGYTTMPIDIIPSGNGVAYYQLQVTVTGGGRNFQARATPLGGQIADTDCFTYTLNDAGSRDNLDNAGNPLPANRCW